MMKWEYKAYAIEQEKSFWGGKYDSNYLDIVLNEFGADGWELVNTVPSNHTYGATASLIFIFKRAK